MGISYERSVKLQLQLQSRVESIQFEFVQYRQVDNTETCCETARRVESCTA